jgi:hypothetical protein
MAGRLGVITLGIILVAACGGSKGGGSTPSNPTAPSPPASSWPLVGLWNATLPSAPAGSGTLSFRVTSATSLTFVSTRVPTFSSMSGCASTWNQVVAIDGGGAFTATLTAGNTSITITGRFDSDTTATGTVVGTCSGGLILLGQTFRASWASN